MIAIVAGLVAAALAPVLVRALGDRAAWVIAIVPAAIFGYLTSRVPEIAAGAVVREEVRWAKAVGVRLAFALDGLSLVFGLLITGLGAHVVIYTGGYFRCRGRAGGFLAALLAFMSSMLGLVLADDVIVLFLFWELTGLCSFVLIGHRHEREPVRRAAKQALLVTGGGGLALLGGLLLLSRAAGGTFSITAILERADAIRAHALYEPAFFLIAIGAVTKSAQVPFHGWLPNAMAAPTPASAYLHSATMVKAGIYLLARLHRALGGTPEWLWTLSLVGAATMTVGAVQAVRQVDLKRVLAYSTVTALGTLVVLLGLSFQASIKAAILFLIVHSLYKGALFMVAGAVDERVGTRDVRALGGIARIMPWTAAAASGAGLSMAGLPPLVGFIGKQLKPRK